MAIALLSYLFGLIAKIPARVVIPENEKVRVGGSMWSGEAVYSSLLRLQWRWAPLSSLANLAFAVDWRASGGGTDISGAATRSGGVYRLSHISGLANGSLLDVLVPDLPLTCRFLADIAVDGLVLGGGEDAARGRMRTSPMHCVGRGSPEAGADLPAMSGTIAPGPDGSSGSLTSLASNGRMLEVRLTPGGDLTIAPTEGALRLAPAIAGLRIGTTVR